jgi:hypothetical protein
MKSVGGSKITCARSQDFAAKDFAANETASLLSNRSGYRSAADICPQLIRALDQLIL